VASVTQALCDVLDVALRSALSIVASVQKENSLLVPEAINRLATIDTAVWGVVYLEVRRAMGEPPYEPFSRLSTEERARILTAVTTEIGERIGVRFEVP
jgi:hypothetical protein